MLVLKKNRNYKYFLLAYEAAFWFQYLAKNFVLVMVQLSAGFPLTAQKTKVYNLLKGT